MRLIDADALLDKTVKRNGVWNSITNSEGKNLEEIVSEMLSVEQQEQKTGHWIVHPKGIYAHLVCDKCLSRAPYDCQANYCPNCGAKMTGESKG